MRRVVFQRGSVRVWWWVRPPFVACEAQGCCWPSIGPHGDESAVSESIGDRLAGVRGGGQPQAKGVSADPDAGQGSPDPAERDSRDLPRLRVVGRPYGQRVGVLRGRPGHAARDQIVQGGRDGEADARLPKDLPEATAG